MTERRSDPRPPWKKKNPKAKSGKSVPLTPEEKGEARARARKAGRRYPNLVDNMAVARTKSEAADEPARETRARSSAGTRTQPSCARSSSKKR
jgi:hypothetical protein